MGGLIASLLSLLFNSSSSEFVPLNTISFIHYSHIHISLIASILCYVPFRIIYKNYFQIDIFSGSRHECIGCITKIYTTTKSYQVSV